MQDRFKFRVFISDKKNSKNSLTGMFKVHSLHTGTNKAIISSLYGNVSIKLDNNILMQCTGLKDKNGKLIYEGDIISENWHKYILEWGRGDFQLRDFAKGSVYTFPAGICIEKCEIIGNIYQNPELLEDNNGYSAKVCHGADEAIEYVRGFIDG